MPTKKISFYFESTFYFIKLKSNQIFLQYYTVKFKVSFYINRILIEKREQIFSKSWALFFSLKDAQKSRNCNETK